MGCNPSQLYEKNNSCETTFMMQVSKSELIHHRLQAMLREHSFSDLKYLGVRPDSIGIDQHWYRIGEAEVPVDAITELESEETDDESDTI